METVLLGAGTLTRFVAIKSSYYWGQGYANRNDGGTVCLGQQDVYSPYVKIEAERATVDDKYVNLRFCHSNKYWERKANSVLIVAESNKPEEDTGKSSCTLFEAVKVDGTLFYLKHVHSGGRLLLDASMNFYVEENPEPTQGYLSFVNWDDLVKLPQNVAFKGDNGKILGGVVVNNCNYLRFSFNDPNANTSIQEVHLMNDGHIRIKSKEFGKFWRRSPNWIWGDSTDTTANNKDTLFWPVKIDETTIALRNAGNNNFCKRLTAENNVDCLNAAVNTITAEARLVVQELVLETKVYNVRYWLENSRIYNETPFLAGTTTAFNYSDMEAGIGVEVAYEDFKSESFSRSVSLSLGVTVGFEASVPFIAKSSIEVGIELNMSLEWNTTTSSTKSVKATGSVPVPPQSKATVSYIGTMGACDVPFSYTQQDRRSTDGVNEETEHIDGVFRGVNAYNFTFIVEKTEPL